VDVPAMTLQLGDVSAMLRESVQASSARLNRSVEDMLSAVESGACEVCESIRYGLARAVAEYLGSVDPSVKAIYLYEPEYATAADEPVAERPNMSPGISMLVWADRKSPALSAVLEALSEALAVEGARLACPKANALCWMLDAQIVDDQQVAERSGYGALVSSVFVRPVELWHR
jgi:hypothetical protein